MSQLCDECLRPIKPFDVCDHGQTEKTSEKSWSSLSMPPGDSSRSGRWLLIVAPLGAVALDWLVPAWSTLPLTLLFWLAGSLPFAYMWVKRIVGIPRSFRLQWRYILGAVLAPVSFRTNMTAKAALKSSMLWALTLLLAVVTVQSVATPANMSGLTRQIRAEVKQKWNIGIDVRCPGPQSALPGNSISCTASKRVVVVINLPAKVQVKNLLGQVSWNVSTK